MTKLFRPVGLNELALIWDSGAREFPPRLPDQPIFYPVTTAEYAAQIARDWNTRSPSYAGYVTSFEVEDAYLSRFDRHIVGSAVHEEYWIPAKNLPEFNKAIRGLIETEAAFFGDSFVGFIPDQAGLKGKSAEEQFVTLVHSWNYSRMDFCLEISVNRKAVYLNCLFWLAHDFQRVGCQSKSQVRDARGFERSLGVQPGCAEPACGDRRLYNAKVNLTLYRNVLILTILSLP